MRRPNGKGGRATTRARTWRPGRRGYPLGKTTLVRGVPLDTPLVGGHRPGTPGGLARGASLAACARQDRALDSRPIARIEGRTLRGFCGALNPRDDASAGATRSGYQLARPLAHALTVHAPLPEPTDVAALPAVAAVCLQIYVDGVPMGLVRVPRVLRDLNKDQRVVCRAGVVTDPRFSRDLARAIRVPPSAPASTPTSTPRRDPGGQEPFRQTIKPCWIHAKPPCTMCDDAPRFSGEGMPTLYAAGAGCQAVAPGIGDAEQWERSPSQGRGPGCSALPDRSGLRAPPVASDPVCFPSREHLKQHKHPAPAVGCRNTLLSAHLPHRCSIAPR